MVISTDVEESMVLAVVPTYQFIVFLDEREETIFLLLVVLTMLHLCQQPRTADDSMSFQQFQSGRCLHLTTDDRGQILFDGQLIDSHNLVTLDHQSQRTQEYLCLLALPVEVDTDGDVE